MPLARRSTKQNGYVNFPVNSTEYRNSNEGGMFVTLAVIEKDIHSWGKCCGYHNSQCVYNEMVAGIYPDIEESDFFIKDEHGYFSDSISLLANLTLASTGWSGYSDKKGLWKCTFKDLNEDGKALYKSLKKLYPKCKFHLITWLDT